MERTFSRLTGHWSDCKTYETLDASDCDCWEDDETDTSPIQFGPDDGTW